MEFYKLTKNEFNPDLDFQIDLYSKNEFEYAMFITQNNRIVQKLEELFDKNGECFLQTLYKRKGKDSMFLALKDKKIVAMIFAKPINTDGLYKNFSDEYWFINNLIVDKNYHGKNIGKQLCLKVINDIKPQGAKYLSLNFGRKTKSTFFSLESNLYKSHDSNLKDFDMTYIL